MPAPMGPLMQGHIRCSCGAGYDIAASAEPKENTPEAMQRGINKWIAEHGHGKAGDGFVVEYEMWWNEPEQED